MIRTRTMTQDEINTLIRTRAAAQLPKPSPVRNLEYAREKAQTGRSSQSANATESSIVRRLGSTQDQRFADLEDRVAKLEFKLSEVERLAVKLLMSSVTAPVTGNAGNGNAVAQGNDDGNAPGNGNKLSAAEKMRRYRQRRKQAAGQ